jgi:DNA-binding MarR family transcriptional regulator
MLEQAMPEQYYTVDSLQPDTSIGFLIKRSGVLMTQIAERAFESQPISFTQWIILMLLTYRPHASPSELSSLMGHDMGALTRLVDELERAALVLRERSRHDRRAVEIAIAPEGRRLAQAGKRVLVDLLNQLVAPYSRAEIDALIPLLQRLVARMQETVTAAPPAEPASAATKQVGSRGTTRTAAKAAGLKVRTPRRKPLE